ncbi:MAG TPA: tetratricopeptide repeat protein [Candidatus Aquilonibacter sp.]|nr:tetratricopeptide repeat protein [Candidatus Aquilonibacter sp.]
MRRLLPLLLLTAVAMPVWSAPQSGQKPPPSPPGSSSSSKPDRTPPPSEPVIDPNPPNADEDIEVASFYLRKGDTNAAIPRLQEAIQLAPKNAKARLMLGESYERTHDNDSAVKTYRDYLKDFPHASDAKKIEKKIEKLTAR